MRKDWVVILAGGEGVRLQPFVRKWLGASVPKQYCTFHGNRSLLQQTFERACSICPREHIVTVIGNGHTRYLATSGADLSGTVVLEQPCLRGTLSGLLLGTSYILSRDPEASLLVLPSDHFVHPEDLFVDQAREMLRLAPRFPDELLLMAVLPASAEEEYGWIRPQQELRDEELHNRYRLFRVRRFVEKPDRWTAERCLTRRCFWNTMVTATQAQALWKLTAEFYPEAVKDFALLRDVLTAVRRGRVPAPHSQLAILNLYKRLPQLDFSRNLLRQVPGRILVSLADELVWSDWGRIERIMGTLSEVGIEPAFEKALGPSAA